MLLYFTICCYQAQNILPECLSNTVFNCVVSRVYRRFLRPTHFRVVCLLLFSAYRCLESCNLWIGVCSNVEMLVQMKYLLLRHYELLLLLHFYRKALGVTLSGAFRTRRLFHEIRMNFPATEFVTRSRISKEAPTALCLIQRLRKCFAYVGFKTIRDGNIRL